MIKEFIGTGKTVAEATEAAKAGLRAPVLADINIEVITMPKSKILGLFGGHDAQVKAWYDDGKKERAPRAEKKVPPKRQDRKPQEKKQPPKKEPLRREDAPKKEAAFRQFDTVKESAKTESITADDIDTNVAVSYLADMLKGLKIENADITARVEDGVLQMEISCDDYGIIIGRRGETLDALQYLTGLAVKKNCDKYVRVTLNVGNYREKRMETLKSVARKNAYYVLKTGRRYTFEPMNPYERRIIHTAVQDIDGVESMSVGYGQERKVVITPTEPFAPRRSSAPARKAAPRTDRADLPRFGKIEVNRD